MLKHNDQILNTADEIEGHVVSYFENIFGSDNNCTEDGLAEEVIPNIVSSAKNKMLTDLPTFDEVKHAVFSMNSKGAPGPYGFGAFFYQEYWDIIVVDD